MPVCQCMSRGNKTSKHKPRIKLSSDKLRMITYVSPDVPVALLELLRDYLEEVTRHEAYLIYETRWTGPASDRHDPFTGDDVDIAFMDSAAYRRLKMQNNAFVELCQAAPLHAHPKADGRPVYFSDIIVLKSNSDRFRNFDALKGCRWVYNSDLSFTGNLVVLDELKKQGTNASFFGQCTQSGSHMKSIQMVLDGRADATAVDSIALTGFIAENAEFTDCFHVVKSLGPLPVYAIVFNSRLSAEMKGQITDGLMRLGERPEWRSRFQRWGLFGFSGADESSYGQEDLVVAHVWDSTIVPTYY